MGSLPSPDGAFRSLLERGEQFGDDPDSISCLGDFHFQHPRRGQSDVLVDDRVLPVIGRMYADDELHNALRDHDARVESFSEVVRLAERHMNNSALMWGFSGFATAGYDFTVEGQGMDELYDRLIAIDRLPALAIDGAARAGVLGLSGVIAARRR